ncbi:hypothetical protein Tco_1396177 [Tanacetum coccineum]
MVPQLQRFWMNKADIETMSIDDLYNNFKIVEQDVNKFVGTSTSAQNMAFMTAPRTSSANDVNTAKPTYEVSTVSPNVADIETMSIDYNNFKIVEQDVKKSVGTSSGAQNLAFMTAPSTSSTNDVNTTNIAYEVSTVSPNINTLYPQVSTTNFSDNTVYAFMVENPNGSNLLQWDLEQIHEDDLEAIDLK